MSYPTTLFDISHSRRIEVHQYNNCISLNLRDMVVLHELIDKKLCQVYLRIVGTNLPSSSACFVAWPSNWPYYKQDCLGSWEKRCDMLVGPCCCGSWHQVGEFEIKNGLLYRDGRKVNFLLPEGRKGIPYESNSSDFVTVRPRTASLGGD